MEHRGNRGKNTMLPDPSHDQEVFGRANLFISLPRYQDSPPFPFIASLVLRPMLNVYPAKNTLLTRLPWDLWLFPSVVI